MWSNSTWSALTAVSLLNFNCGVNSNSLSDQLWNSWKIMKEHLIVHLDCWLWKDKVFLLPDLPLPLLALSCSALLLLCLPGEYLHNANHLWSRRYSFQTFSSCGVNLPGKEVFSGSLSLPVSPCHLCQHLHPCRWRTSTQNKVAGLMSRCWTSADQTAGTSMRPPTGLTAAV